MRRHRTVLFALATALSVTACSAPSGTAAGEGSENVLTSADIAAFAATDAGATAYDLVNQRRRLWLVTRGAEGSVQAPSVYDGANRLGDADALRRINLAQLEQIEYLDPRVARNRYGVQNHPVGSGGAIIVSFR